MTFDIEFDILYFITCDFELDVVLPKHWLNYYYRTENLGRKPLYNQVYVPKFRFMFFHFYFR